METKRMRYAQYKKHYADCKTVPGSYDKADRTIEVLLPEGRVKPSGVRGEHFRFVKTLANGNAYYRSEGRLYGGIEI